MTERSAEEIRAELSRVGKERVKNRGARHKNTSEMKKWLLLARDHPEMTLDEGVKLAGTYWSVLKKLGLQAKPEEGKPLH